MSSGARVLVSKGRESSYGTAPSSGWREVRRTGGGGSDDLSYEQSDVVRSDLMSDAGLPTDREASYTIEDEWAFEAHSEEMEDVLRTTRVAISIDASMTATASGNTIDAAASTFDSVLVGHRLRFFNFTTNANSDGYFDGTVVAKAGDGSQITLAGITLQDEGPVAGATLRATVYRNGTTLHTASVEQEYLDLTTHFAQYLGLVANNWGWTFSHPGKITTGFDYVGKSGGMASSTIVAGGLTNYDRNRSTDSSQSFMELMEGGSLTGVCVQDFDLTVSAPVELKKCAGQLGSSGAFPQTFEITGSFSAYNDPAFQALDTKRINSTETSLEWHVSAPSELAGTHFYLPGVLITQSSPDGAGKNDQVMVPAEYMAHVKDGFMLQVTELPASDA